MTREDYRRSLKGRRMYVGMDLSTTTDMTAIVGVFPDEEGYDVLAQFFVPKENIVKRSQRDRVPYVEWERQGYLVATPGASVDYEYVRNTLKDWASEFDLRSIAYDPFNARDLVTRLKEQDGFVCVEMRQGFISLSSPAKALEIAVLSKALRHDGHPVLRWCVGNVVVEMDAAGNLKPSKRASTEKIDGVAALVMAIDQMDRNSATKPPSFGLFVLGR